MIDLGHRLDLFATMAATGPATSAELAARAGLQERYVREWLGAMATSGIVSHDAADRRYALPPEHAAALTGPSSRNQAPRAAMATLLGRNLGGIEDVPAGRGRAVRGVRARLHRRHGRPESPPHR